MDFPHPWVQPRVKRGVTALRSHRPFPAPMESCSHPGVPQRFQLLQLCLMCPDVSIIPPPRVLGKGLGLGGDPRGQCPPNPGSGHRLLLPWKWTLISDTANWAAELEFSALSAAPAVGVVVGGGNSGISHPPRAAPSLPRTKVALWPRLPQSTAVEFGIGIAGLQGRSCCPLLQQLPEDAANGATSSLLTFN